MSYFILISLVVFTFAESKVTRRLAKAVPYETDISSALTQDTSASGTPEAGTHLSRANSTSVKTSRHQLSLDL